MNHQYRIGELVKGEEERLIILAEDDSQKKKQRRKTSLQRDDGVGEDDNEVSDTAKTRQEKKEVLKVLSKRKESLLRGVEPVQV